MSQRVSLILFYKSTNTYALNVLVGAVQSWIRSSDLEIELIGRVDRLVCALRTAVQRGRTVIVGWSFYSPHFAVCVRDLKAVREAVPDECVVHVAGGVHATAEPEMTLHAGFDWAAVGEAEWTIVRLVEAALAGRPMQEVPGLACLEENRLVLTGPAQPVALDEFPPFAPEYPRVNPIEITRGCIYACHFCQTPFMFKARFRHRSIEPITHYVRFMLDRGARDIRFITPTSLSYGSNDETVRLDRIEELLSSLHRAASGKGRIFFGTFPSEVRPEHVSPEALQMLKKYVANDNLLMGGQSGSNSILHSMHRGHDVDSIRRAVRYCLEAGFFPQVDLIFGLPGETADDVEATLQLADELAGRGARIHGHTFMPLPGTPLKNAPPGHVAPEVAEKLYKLVSLGKLYGRWQDQASVAAELAAGRTGASAHGQSRSGIMNRSR
jgi:B12-binding domain/radical SAM domain protein